MDTRQDRIAYLLELYTSKKSTAAEEQELFMWVEEAQEDSLLRDYVRQVWTKANVDHHSVDLDWDRMFKDIIKQKPVQTIPIKRHSLLQLQWLRIAAVFTVIILISTAIYYMRTSPKKEGSSKTNLVLTEDDVKPPQGNKAMITLANGSTIPLESLNKGLLARQGGVTVVKLADGKIAYQQEDGKIVSEMQFNTLYNPKGSKVIDMQLIDGTHVWLNAGSSITYPVSFIGNERKVKLTGEGYFEVHHNALMPFKVVKEKTEVVVLGTHFNINAYDDEPSVKITLLQGRVSVNNSTNKRELNPGQQAIMGNTIDVKDNVDLEHIMAWKNGYFSFNATPLEEVLKQIARWYDVEVKYEGSIPNRKFGGKIHRNATIQQVLKILEESGITYTMKNKVLLILNG